jgi:hypothetical protein
MFSLAGADPQAAVIHLTGAFNHYRTLETELTVTSMALRHG